jgi:hypothetical protein
MAHFKCLHCRSRVWLEGAQTADLCPGCGSELEPVAELSELVGLRALRTRPHGTHRDSPDRFDRISLQIREAIAKHDAERIDADRP